MAATESALRRTMKNSASGTVAGMAICLVGHPFDTLKVRLQTQPVENPLYKGLLDCFLKTVKGEGLGGLYKGVGLYFPVKSESLGGFYQVVGLHFPMTKEGLGGLYEKV